MSKKVIILGGGVAGMSAAHELVERGFNVEVYERWPVPGGKARSLDVKDSAVDGRKPLPGEHGFRFFPRFYKHVTDTMKRIPYRNNARGVYDNLVDTTRIEVARYDLPPLVVNSRFPRSLADFTLIMANMWSDNIGVAIEDEHYFAERVWQIMTSCDERRLAEYEKIGWWDFIGAGSRSLAYQDYFGHGLTRSLVAAKGQLASTRTVGDVLVQLLFDILEPGVSSDRLLNGPTNEVWIEPWLDYLRSRGVEYHLNAEVKSINCEGGRIKSATVSEDGFDFEKTGDYYIAAFPVEVMAAHLTAEMLSIDPDLAKIQQLAPNVSWMNGAQFYLNEDLPIARGHELYLNSQWALTSVSQHQFWNIDLSQYGDGKVNGIISVDISEWNEPGLNGKTAKECTRDEIRDEIWAQLKKSLNYGGVERLRDDHLHSWTLDPDIVFFEDPDNPHPSGKQNREPLLVNLVDTWKLRPDARTGIPNLFLASDYVQTYTDLATMEGANEAARRAVNYILDAAGASVSKCELWKLHEPAILAPWRHHDRTRFEKGLPWDGRLLG